jgi:hypothetical protein
LAHYDFNDTFNIFLQAAPIDLASESWKLDWIENGGVLHAKLACGYGFWKVPNALKIRVILSVFLN